MLKNLCCTLLTVILATFAILLVLSRLDDVSKEVLLILADLVKLGLIESASLLAVGLLIDRIEVSRVGLLES